MVSEDLPLLLVYVLDSDRFRQGGRPARPMWKCLLPSPAAMVWKEGKPHPDNRDRDENNYQTLHTQSGLR